MKLDGRRRLLTAFAVASLLAGCEVAEVQSISSPGGRITRGWRPEADGGIDDAGRARDAGRRPDAGERRDLGIPHDAGPPPDLGVPRDVLERLQRLPGLSVSELVPDLPGTRAFLLGFVQPEDHANPRRKAFNHRMVLIHRSEAAPMVLHTTGYGMLGDPLQFIGYLTEPAMALEANQLTVEHRYFGTSIATNADWTHLTVEQSAHDSHRIVETLSEVYTGAWIGTGTSKGGLTALLHHRYFPEDLDGVVAYVAPITFGLEDLRYIPFVAAIGPTDGRCRMRVQDMAVELVERRAEAALYLLQVDPGAAMFTLPGLEAFAAYSAYQYHWTFWQYLGSVSACASLPPRGASIDAIAPWFGMSPASYLELGRFDPELSPYGFQVQRELGGPALDNGYIEEALLEVDFDALPEIVVDPEPWGMPPAHDPVPMVELDAFLRNEAERVIAIYGAWDPWTAGEIDLDPANDTHLFRAAAANHAAALIDLAAPEIDLALARLRTWAGRRSFAEPAPAQLEAERQRLTAGAASHRAFVERLFEYERRAAAERVRRAAFGR